MNDVTKTFASFASFAVKILNRVKQVKNYESMSQKRFLQIVNFDELQHYKDRNPIWIKLHCAILDDYEFSALSDETKFHALGLMVLAARLNNKFPDDERWLRLKIGANSEINLKVLLEIRFLEVIREEKTDAKNSSNARKLNKTKGESASAILEDAENCASTEQNRTEQKKTEEMKTDHTTTQQSERAAEPVAENRVVVCDFSKSSQTESESENANGFGKLTIVPEDGGGKGNLSQFTLPECLSYVELCVAKGDAIKNPRGLAAHLFQTGKSDAFIRALMFPEEQKQSDLETYGAPRSFSDEPCRVCFGAKMADADGQGYRKCGHCKDERGTATGKEPQE